MARRVARTGSQAKRKKKRTRPCSAPEPPFSSHLRPAFRPAIGRNSGIEIRTRLARPVFSGAALKLPGRNGGELSTCSNNYFVSFYRKPRNWRERAAKKRNWLLASLVPPSSTRGAAGHAFNTRTRERLSQIELSRYLASRWIGDYVFSISVRYFQFQATCEWPSNAKSRSVFQYFA